MHRRVSGEHAIARLAAAQLGLVTRRQLLALGVGRGAIHSRIARGLLHPVHRGVYRLGHSAPIPFAREMAALLACGPTAALSHRSAAFVWALIATGDGPVEVTVPDRGSGRAHRDGIVIHRPSVGPADLTCCRGLRVTTVARTLVDLAATARPEELERATTDAERRRLVTRPQLRRELARGRRPGVGAVRALLDRPAGPAFTRPHAERRLLALVRAARLPAPDHNVRVGRFEVELAWLSERLVVEVDGYRFHADRAAFELDRARDAELQVSGFRVIRVTWRQLTAEPEAVVARLAAALADR